MKIYNELMSVIESAKIDRKDSLVEDLKKIMIFHYPNKRFDIVSKTDRVIVKDDGNTGIVFKAIDFNAKKKASSIPNINDVVDNSDDETHDISNQVGNMWKAISEKKDDELKIKFDKDIKVAIDFLNQMRKELDLELVSYDDYKTFSAKFFTLLRSTIALKLK